jgi:hypothetical protein
MKITNTINANKLIYKIIPINENFYLCGRSYILDILRIADMKLIQVCKFETSIYDISLVTQIG